MFNKNIVEDIKKHAEKIYPEESCGLVVNNEYVSTKNIHEDPKNHFRIDIKEYSQFLQNSSLQAIVHSHTNGRDFPSKNDMIGQMRMAIPWGIVLATIHGIHDPFWFGDQVPVPNLLGREFRHGVTDCYALVRDWYKENKNIILPNLARDWEWWNTKENILINHFKEFGFVEISKSELEWGDCVMGKIGSNVTNHCGVYLGNNELLHHLPKRLSRRDMLSPWTRIITHYCRYSK